MLGRRRWDRRHRAFAAALPLGLALLLGCGAPSGSRLVPRDFVSHLADDGSLAAGLEGADPFVRGVALRGLARLPPDEKLAPRILELAREESVPAVLTELTFLLGRWRPAGASEALAPLLSHRESAVRAAALWALGRLADDGVLGTVVSALDDPAPEVRGAAALALFRLDGRRYAHARTAQQLDLAARDAALSAALHDADAGVRWRAAYALAGVRSRPGLAEALSAAVGDDDPLVRLFALRGLAALQKDGLADALELAVVALDDEDPRVVVEAARVLAAAGYAERLVLLARTAAVPAVRRVALEGLGELAAAARDAQGRVELPWADEASARLPQVAATDLSPAVRREALATLARLGAGAGAGAGRSRGEQALGSLATSSDPRDRERAAVLLGERGLADETRREALLHDPAPSVRAAAASALGTPPSEAPLARTVVRLLAALAEDDPAVVGSAAEAAGPVVRDGRAPPRLVSALAEALERLSAPDEGLSPAPEREEARVALTAALGLPTPEPFPAPPSEGPLLARLLAEQQRAAADPHPRVLLQTERGDLVLELDRRLAPRHTSSFLELVGRGFYDGLDVHRVVPNFVVQGLDPRGDGWGTGGRRLPDEFGPAPFLTGTLGMPRTSAPHTGGCQIFLTHVPTPHLDGEYTVMGRVVEGLEVVAALEIGDVVLRARRTDGIERPPAAETESFGETP